MRGKPEPAALPDEQRAALWRNARLSALGDSVAKIRHDLRNILAPALLAAERLNQQGDPAARHAAKTLIPAMERAVEMVSRIADYAQEGPPAIIRSPVALRALLDEAADVIPTTAGIAVDNQVPNSLLLDLDRIQLYRVLVNLLRNAAEAGATQITITLEAASPPLLVIADNGPGLPPEVLANLFRPFNSSGNERAGLGLAIARELIRAHGGDLHLRDTGWQGTAFVLCLGK